MLEQELENIMNEDLAEKEKLKKIFVGYIQFGLTHQSHYETMFLIKDEEVQHFISQGPDRTYEKFARSVHSLCGNKITLQEIWSIFLSLHGFVTHYLRHVSEFEEVKGLVNSHADFLVKAIYSI